MQAKLICSADPAQDPLLPAGRHLPVVTAGASIHHGSLCKTLCTPGPHRSSRWCVHSTRPLLLTNTYAAPPDRRGTREPCRGVGLYCWRLCDVTSALQGSTNWFSPLYLNVVCLRINCQRSFHCIRQQASVASLCHQGPSVLCRRHAVPCVHPQHPSTASRMQCPGQQSIQ